MFKVYDQIREKITIEDLQQKDWTIIKDLDDDSSYN